MATPVVKPAEKKPLGRPPRVPKPAPLEKYGIQTAPKCKGHRLEFTSGSPMAFKSLFAYFKNIKAAEIHVRCSPERITFFTRDHSSRSRVVVQVEGKEVHWYYSERTFWMAVTRESVDKIFASINKSITKITMVQSYEDPEQINIIFHDGSIDKDCDYRIRIPVYTADPDLYAAENDVNVPDLSVLFPVRFTLTAQQFKKTVVDASHHSNVITIEKRGVEPLQITYTKEGLAYHEVYRTPEKIDLTVTNLSPGGLSCPIRVADVKALSASMVTETAQFHCCEGRPMLFRCILEDRFFTVDTLTELD